MRTAFVGGSTLLHAAAAGAIAIVAVLSPAPPPPPQPIPIASISARMATPRPEPPATEPVSTALPFTPIVAAPEPETSFPTPERTEEVVPEPERPVAQTRPSMRTDRPLTSTSRLASDDECAVVAPVASLNPPPEYPRAARRHGYEGRVTVRATVGVDGVPRDVTVASPSGHACLDKAAVDAVKRWRFEPARRGGAAVEGTVDVPFRFELSPK